jgi:hypothetical protein
MTDTISVRVSDYDLCWPIRELARRNHRSVAAQVTIMLEEWLHVDHPEQCAE